MNRIIFYNDFSNRDIFYSQGFIRKIIELNPEYKYFHYSKKSGYIFNELNIQYIYNEKFIENREKMYFKLDDNTICINMWILGWKKYIDISEIDTYIDKYDPIFRKVIDEINEKYNLDIKYYINNIKELIPILPKIELNDFDEWKKYNNKKMIFYYNYYGLSSQKLPFRNIEEHDNLIINLSANFPNINFLIAASSNNLLNYIQSNNANNIILCDKIFGCYEDKLGKNLTKLAHISMKCDIIITYDIGACMYYFNQANLYNKNLKLVCSPVSRYVNNVNKITESIGIKEFAKYIKCNNMHELFIELFEILIKMLNNHINIVFYNIQRAGDILFSQGFIKEIIKQNSSYKFFYYCNYASCLFNEININKYTTNGNLIHKNSNIAYFMINNTLYINTWVGGWNKYHNQPHIDTYIDKHIEIYKDIFKDINKDYNIELKLDIRNIINIIPKLPKVNIDKFELWKKNNNKKIIFYYNYISASNIEFIIKNMSIHDLIIINMINKYKDYYIIIPNKTVILKKYVIENNINNLIFCDETFDIDMNIDGTNICQLAKITEYCDYTILFDSGVCMFYFNIDNIYNKKTKIIYTKNTRYGDNINKIINMINGYDFVKCIKCNNENDIINNMSLLIK